MAECKCMFYSNFSGGAHAEKLLCKTCRADLELGRMVRAMPMFGMLSRRRDMKQKEIWTFEHSDLEDTYGITPEEALREVGR